jgi:hypothetical protein
MGMERFGVCFAVLSFSVSLRQLRRRSRRGQGAGLRVTYTDARRGAKAADLCDDASARCPAAPPDLLAQDPVGAADVAGALGRDRRGLEAEPVLADGPAASCTMPITSGGPTVK